MATKPQLSPPVTGDRRVDRFNQQVADRLNALVRAGRLTKEDLDEWDLNLSAVTSIDTDAPITGGPITGTGTIGHDVSGVTPGAYSNANITVDEFGHVTEAEDGSAATGSGGDAPAILFPPGFVTANTTSVVTQNSGDSYFFYMGQAKAGWTSVKVRYRVTRAIATVTWAELAIYKGTPTIGGSPTLTRVGYVDTSTTWLATGQTTTTVTVSGVSAQDDLWVVFGNQATTTLQYRAGSVNEDIGTGVLQTGTLRPSTTLSASGLAVGNQYAWIAIQGS